MDAETRKEAEEEASLHGGGSSRGVGSLGTGGVVEEDPQAQEGYRSIVPILELVLVPVVQGPYAFHDG